MDELRGDCVFKWSKYGYDGKGTLIVSKDQQSASALEITEFCDRALERGAGVYAEKKMNFKRELAVIGVQSVLGEFISYPLVVSEQQGGICKTIRGPASSLGVDPRFESFADRYARKLAQSGEIFGCFAIEMFETDQGELFVNELAPRVHNSGHYTQDAGRTSQFENHWRALLGLPLGDTRCAPAFVMRNLLGPAGILSAPADVLPVPPREVRAHWYGKTAVKAGRKMGHLNAVGANSGEIESLVKILDACERDWVERVLLAAPMEKKR
jgi:5-(carboxyamino)imidazole ribonucleotide synthase